MSSRRKPRKKDGEPDDGQMALGLTRFINRIIKYSVQVLIIYTIFNIMFNSTRKKISRKRTTNAHANFDHSSILYKDEFDGNDQCPLLDSMIMLEEDLEDALKEKEDQIPKYDTRKTRFLYPQLMQGLHGQIRGLRESIYLAIKLDRTLVLPPFFIDPWLDDAEGPNQKVDERLLPEPYDPNEVKKEEEDIRVCETTGNCTAEEQDLEHEIKLDHEYSVSLDVFDDDDFEPGLSWKQDFFKPKGNVIPLSAVIDVELLATLLPVITTSQMKEDCYGEFDVIYLGRTHYCHGPKTMRLIEFEQMTGMMAVNRTKHHSKRCPDFLAPTQPEGYNKPDTHADGERVDLPFDGEDIVSNIYADDSVCAAWIYPYGNIDFSMLFREQSRADVLYFSEQERGKNHHSRKTANKEELDIVIDAIIGTTRAQYIRHIANAFIKSVFKDKILIVAHWRFTAEHWFEPCRIRNGRAKKDWIYCRQLRKYQKSPDPDDYLFYGFLSKISPLKATGQALIIYLSAPDQLLDKLVDIRRDLEKYSGQTVVTQQELRNFLAVAYSKCDFVNRHLDMVVQLVEQEMSVTNAVAYMRSTNSLWSYHIHQERFVRGRTTYDFTVLDVLRAL